MFVENDTKRKIIVSAIEKLDDLQRLDICGRLKVRVRDALNRAIEKHLGLKAYI